MGKRRKSHKDSGTARASSTAAASSSASSIRDHNHRTEQHDTTIRRQGRRRRQQYREVKTVTSTPADHDYDDIVAQLRRQREKQQAAEGARMDGGASRTDDDDDEATTKGNPEALGRFLYDKTRRAYFPKDSIVRHDQDGDDENAEQSKWDTPPPCSSPARCRSYPHSIRSLRTSCKTSQERRLQIEPWLFLRSSTDRRQRARFASSMAEQILFTSFGLTPATFKPKRNDNESCHLLSWTHDREASRGTSLCKILAPAWSRTLDVLPTIVDKALPHVISIFGQDAYRYLASVRTDRIVESLRTVADIDSIQAVRYSRPALNCQDGSYCVGALCSMAGTGSKIKYARYFPTESTMIPVIAKEVEIDSLQANDFLFLSPSEVIFAGDNSDRIIRPVTYNFDRECEIYKVPRHGFPLSDAICVEAAEPDLANCGSCLFGHKDGSVTFFTRNNFCMNTGVDREFGNVLSLHCFREKQFLARGGAKGMCRLYDLRMLSKMVHEFAPPLASIHRRATQGCNGIATDPCGTLVMSPFVSGKSMQPEMGFWSLRSGDYIGSKPLAPDMDDNEKRHVSVELCSALTPAWEYSKFGSVCLRKGSFGLWYKLAHSFENAAEDNANNIHHMHFDGRLDKDNRLAL